MIPSQPPVAPDVREQAEIYRAFGNFAVDNLFWRLTYLNGDLFRTPNTTDIKQALLKQGEAFRTLFTAFDNSPPAHQLADKVADSNRLFMLYVQRCPGQKPSARETAHAHWVNNGRQAASLLAKLNPFWREPEWSAMITHHIKLLTAIADGTAQGRYDVLSSTAPLCKRLSVDMADYMAAGVVQTPAAPR